MLPATMWVKPPTAMSPVISVIAFAASGFTRTCSVCGWRRAGLRPDYRNQQAQIDECRAQVSFYGP